MPALQSAQIDSFARSAFSDASLQGENGHDLARACAQATAKALAKLFSMAQVMPGIPASAPPPTGSGSTVGPGRLMPPPAGGPGKSDLQPIASSSLDDNGIKGQAETALAKILALALAEGIAVFARQAQVAPGIGIAGFVTASPGQISAPGPTASQLTSIVEDALTGQKLSGENAPDLAAAIAETVASSLEAFAKQALVAPGIPCTPAATAGPGRLM